MPYTQALCTKGRPANRLNGEKSCQSNDKGRQSRSICHIELTRVYKVSVRSHTFKNLNKPEVTEITPS